MYFSSQTVLLLSALSVFQCHAQEMIGNAPNNTDIDVVLITLDDDDTTFPNATVDPLLSNATAEPAFGNSTAAPTMMPTSVNSTMANETDTPMMDTPSPTVAEAPFIQLNFQPTTTTFAPFPTVAIPPQAPQTRRPTTNAPSVSDFPSSGPTLFPTTGQPTIDTAACALYDQCGNLTGDCCPTIDNVPLACCGLGAVEETCELNLRCVDEWGLSGSCCPTLTGEYLDCCDAVPDDCQDGSANCTVLSTREYVGSSARMVGASAILIVAMVFGAM